MKWIEAIIMVLAEEGRPMTYKEITQKILEKKYVNTSGKIPEQIVGGILSENRDAQFQHLCEEGKLKGKYALVGTTVTATHPKIEKGSPAADKSVGRAAPVVARPSASYRPGDPNYRKVSDITDFQDLTQQESKLLELIVNFRLPLVKGGVCFADILKNLEKVEFSKEKKTRPQSIDAEFLRNKLDELKEQIAKIESKIENNPNLRNSYDPLLRRMRSAAEKAEGRLADAGDKVVEKVPVLGEFVSENHPKPKVVIYYKNIQSTCRERWTVMAGVFVHEMFHAWNYFHARGKRSVLAIDEPMVEFGALYFLKELKISTISESHDMRGDVSLVSWKNECIVRDKQESIGNVAAYGFGYYLFENLGESVINSRNWIETYSRKSASINESDEPVKNSESALIPLYPFMSEDEVKEWFNEIIFDGKTYSVTARKSLAAKTTLHVSLQDLVLACIKTIGRKCFDTQDLYAFAPIFKVCVPQCKNLEDALKQQLDELVKEGVLEALPPDCYSIK